MRSCKEITDYERIYPQFVDTKQPLSNLQELDIKNWEKADVIHPILSERPDSNRMDYFDIQYGEHPMQKLDIHHLKGDELRPVIFYIHGGGWIWFDKNQSRYAAPTWVELGYTVISIDYRLATEASHPAQIEDCSLALKWVMDNVQNYGGDPSNIAIIGQSAGGHLTALLSTDKRWQSEYDINMGNVKCWIALSAPLDFTLEENYYHPWMQDFTRSLLLDDENKSMDASPINHITGEEPPSLIIHGGDDWLVPKTNSLSFYTRLVEAGANTTLQILKHYWHCNTLVNYGNKEDELTQVVNKYLADMFPSNKNYI